MHPAALMPHPRVDGANRRRQTSAAIGENQAQRSAFQSTSVEVFQQPFPVGLAFALAAQESQQVPTAIADDAVGHQHLDLLASRWSPHPQAHAIRRVVAVAVVPRLPPPPLIPRPAREPVALALRLQLEKLLPRLPRLSIQIAPETLFHLAQKMLEMLRDRDYLRHWV